MFTFIKTSCTRNIAVSKVRRLMPIDQSLNKDWNTNEAGWLRNDLSALAAATTKEEYNMILERLNAANIPPSNIPEGVTLKDAFALCKPRYCQSENEFADFAVYASQKMLDVANERASRAAATAKPVVSQPPKVEQAASE